MIAFALPPNGKLYLEKYNTTYSFNMQGKNIFTSILGPIGDGKSEIRRFLKYEIISGVCNILATCTSYVVYYFDMNGYYHFCYMFFLLFFAVFNGAGWYGAKIKKFPKIFDAMIQKEEGKIVRVSNVLGKTLTLSNFKED